MGLLLLALFLVSNLTFLLNVFEGVNWVVVLGPVAVVGAVSGFLGRRSRLRRTALVGSVLSWVALLGFGVASFMVPYEPGIRLIGWTADGTQIAYTHTWAAAEGEDGIWWVVRADGSSEPTRWEGPARARLAPKRWETADGRTTVDCPPAGLCVVDADGHRQVLLPGATLPGNVGYLEGGELSPDGTRVAYVAGAGIKSDIVVTTLDRTTETTLIH